MRKYLALVRLAVQNALAYRGPMVVWLASNLVILVTMIAVWTSATGSGLIGGYSKGELVSYYIASLFLQWLNGWYPFYWIRTEVRDGSIAGNTLTKPISFYWRVFAAESGWHLVSTPIGIFASAAVASFVPQYAAFSFGVNFWVAVIAVILSIFVVFTTSLCMGILTFWLTNLNTIDSTCWAANIFLGGQGIPLSFLPPSLLSVVNLLPFRYMFSFPLEIYFNKLNHHELITGFSIQIFWIIILTMLYQVLWTNGRKAYSSFGN